MDGGGHAAIIRVPNVPLYNGGLCRLPVRPTRRLRMDLLPRFIDLVLHLDTHLEALARDYGTWIYGILFVVIFAETGLVVTPFLPGDSLLFVCGALAATGSLDVWVMVVALSVAAIIGNTVNYWVGRYIGPRAFQWKDSRLFNKSALQKTHAFYVRHGGKTIVISRFLPIIRTFAPFVAGIGEMDHLRFQAFNFAGGISWVFALTFAGYFFGNISAVRDNLTLVIVAMVFISAIPAMIGYWQTRRRKGS
jgi:membrane-associated protein